MAPPPKRFRKPAKGPAFLSDDVAAAPASDDATVRGRGAGVGARAGGHASPGEGGAASSDKKAGPFAGLRKRFGGAKGGEEL